MNKTMSSKNNNINNYQARTLPHSVEAEQSVLGCVFLDQDASYTILSELDESDFYLETHKILFDNMNQIIKQNRPVDFVTLVDNLDKNMLIESVGGIEYITTLTNIVPSASNFRHYLDIVKRDSVLRQLIKASQEVTNNTFNATDKEQAIAFAEHEIFQIGKNEERSKLEHIKNSLDEVITKFETIQTDRNSLKGISTGIYGLDKITNGLQNSDLILVAARPGCGKTSLAMNIINHAAIYGKKKAAIFSLEMPKVQLAQRSMCSIAMVDMEKALKGEMSVKDWRAIWAAKEKFANASIHVDDSSLNTPLDILSKCRKLQREQGLDILMIDYLQLMTNGKNGDNRQQEVSEMSRALKVAARDLNIPIIVLSQLSRAAETRKDHRPMLSDLRESGAIEQDADIVLFIYRADMYNDVPEEERLKSEAEIIIAKHRNGATGVVKTKWIPKYTTFANLEKDSNAQSLEQAAPIPEDRDVPPNDQENGEIMQLDDDILDDIF